MCFSVNVNLVKEELENRYGATLIDPDKYRPSYYYHAFGIPEMPVVCPEKPSIIRLYKWGLIPSRTRNAVDANIIRYKTFNARADSLDNKPSFSSSFRTKRCIVPVKGFFEWQHNGKNKFPWYIYRADNEIMSLAGIFDIWTDDNTGEVYNTFSIVTTDANDMMAEIHNSGKRMPVILDKNSERRWIDNTTSPDDAMKLLVPCPSDILKAYTVGSLINSKTADRNKPEVIQPYNYPTDNLLF